MSVDVFADTGAHLGATVLPVKGFNEQPSVLHSRTRTSERLAKPVVARVLLTDA
jgi:hypothetical protein